MLTTVALDSPNPSTARSALGSLGLADIEVRRAAATAWIGCFHVPDPTAVLSRLEALAPPDGSDPVHRWIELTDAPASGIWAHVTHPAPERLTRAMGWHLLEELVPGEGQTVLVGAPAPIGVIALGPSSLMPFYPLDFEHPPANWHWLDARVAGPVHRASILQHDSGVQIGVLAQNQS